MDVRPPSLLRSFGEASCVARAGKFSLASVAPRDNMDPVYMDVKAGSTRYCAPKLGQAQHIDILHGMTRAFCGRPILWLSSLRARSLRSRAAVRGSPLAPLQLRSDEAGLFCQLARDVEVRCLQPILSLLQHQFGVVVLTALRVGEALIIHRVQRSLRVVKRFAYLLCRLRP